MIPYCDKNVEDLYGNPKSSQSAAAFFFSSGNDIEMLARLNYERFENIAIMPPK